MVLLAFSAPAQEPEQPKFGVSVHYVVAPTIVVDRQGHYIDNLRTNEFRLLDNGKVQTINVDRAYHPISMVVAIQANSAMEGMLPKIRKVGSLLEPLVVGEAGEVAILAYDHRIRTMLEFTSDSSKFGPALEKITPGSSSSRMIDSVSEAIRMLSHRPTDHRRVILLIGESRDSTSEGKLRDALTAAELADVAIYSVVVSHLAAAFTSEPMPPRPDPFPPSATLMPGNQPATPQTVMQTTGSYTNSANFIPMFVEIFKGVKGVFVENPSQVFTRYTGGRDYEFVKQRALETAISEIGSELHNQYLLSYSPNDKEEGGFHTIQVYVEGYRGATIRTRPGYWMAAVTETK
jgi:VWFA-related protein